MDPLELGKLLCHCLSPETGEIEVERFERLSDADWRGLVQLAARHGLVPLLYRRLKTHGAGVAVPLEIWRTLQETYLDSSGTSMRLYHQLAEVLRALQEEGIPVIVLKGAYLAQVVYGNAALRPMHDVDLLVKKDDLSRVEEKLQQMGYELFGDRTTQVESHYHFHYTPANGSENVPVEIHWNITYPTPYAVDADGLWARAKPATIADVRTLVLSPEDLLLHVCVHSAHGHVFGEGLRSQCDISAMIQCCGSDLDWEQVRYRASQWRIGRCAYLTLRFARDLWDVAVPGEVLTALDPGNLDTEVVAWAEERIFAQVARPEFNNWGRLEASERLWDKVGVFLRACFPSALYLAKRYNVSPSSARVYFYYPAYLLYLLQEHGPRAWRLLRGDGEMKSWVGRQGQKFAQQARSEARKEALETWLAAGDTRQ